MIMNKKASIAIFRDTFEDKEDDTNIKSEEAELKPHYLGHRQRLRERFLSGDQSKVMDYELLEMLLGLILPRKDTKPLAKRLLKLFGNFSGIIGAEVGQLKAVEGIGDSSIAMFKVIHESICRILKENLMSRPLLNNGERVVDYCRAGMAYLGREQHRILFLNSKNYLIADEMRIEGTIDYTYTYPREIITRALEVRAKSIIMVHNHPSGDPSPSKEDIIITKQVQDIASKMEIYLHDHIIVAKKGAYSMRLAGDI
jgi:DNA repair protein RadC